MDFNAFRACIPKDVDIRPDVAAASRFYIASKLVREETPSVAALFLNRVIDKTKCQKQKFNYSGERDAAQDTINGWGRKDVSKRGKSVLPQAVLYWLFRFEPNPTYFIELAKIVWKRDSEILKRFCYAKAEARPEDAFETILIRFHSEEALSYKIVLGDDRRLSVTYAAAIRLGSSYQAGRGEFQSTKKLLLSRRSTSAALTASVHGAGGYGKSCLAQELCDDEEIRRRFSGGIYWLQFGLLDSSDGSSGGVGLSQAIDRMLADQYTKSKRPLVDWDNRNSDILKLLEVLPAERLLLIADDLWTPQQWSWVAEVPANISVLMTTRRQDIAKITAHEVTIKRLTDDASYKLLTHEMASISPDQHKRLRQIVKKFKGWPLIISLANGVFKYSDSNQQSKIDITIGKYEKFFADDQINAWDIPEIDEEAGEKRRRLVGFCIEAGLKAIDPSNHPELLRKFSIFPDDTDIPFSVIIDFWNRCGFGRISYTRGLSLLRHFNDFSFFSSFNQDEESLKLHDEILAYFRSNSEEEQKRSLHRELLASMRAHCDKGWDTLPNNHTYGWTKILHHLEKSGSSDEADDLRTDFHWLKAKLAAVGSSELRRSFAWDVGRSDVRLVFRAVTLSISVIDNQPQSLAHQLFGRLSHENDTRLNELVRAAQSDPSFWPIPIKPHLPPIGSGTWWFLNHSGKVDSFKTARLGGGGTGAQIGRREGEHGPFTRAAFDRSGSMIVTASLDQTVRLWDAETGTEIGKPIEGHRGPVRGVAFDPSGNMILSASDDGTARLWDAKTGAEIGKPFEGHRGPVKSAAFDPSGRKVVTTSDDGTARLWNAKTRAQIGKPFKGHGDVKSAAFDRSGCKIVTTSDDGTARLWNAKTCAQIGKPLEGHRSPITDIAFDPSGNKIVTGSWDETVRLWDAKTGAQIGEPLEGHRSFISDVAFDSSGNRIVTGSWDKTVRLWDAEMGICVAIIHFDDHPSCVAWHHEYLAIGLGCDLYIFITKQENYHFEHVSPKIELSFADILAKRLADKV